MCTPYLAPSFFLLTITLTLGFFILLSNQQVCMWQESTSSGLRARRSPKSALPSALAQVLSRAMSLGNRGNSIAKQALGDGQDHLLHCLH